VIASLRQIPTRLPARAFWVTLLDAALIISASAAVVILLGGRGRIDIGGMRISLRAATNLLMFSAGFAALRLWLGQGLRPLPALGRADGSYLEAERARFAAPQAAGRAVWFYAAATLLGSLVWILPHLRHPRMVPDAGDPVFSAWRIARLAHQLVTDPRHLFDGNIFYPLPLTLTYSDATALEGLLGAPFVLAGADPLLVANVLTLLAFPACGLAFFYTVWRLTGEPDAAFLAGLVGAWYPFHAEHYSHLELQWVMFAPLAIVTGLRMLAQPRVATGLRFGAAVSAQWFASMYLGVMLLAFLAPFLVVIALARRVRPSRQVLVASAAAAAIVLPAFAGLGLPYVMSRATRGERGLSEVSDGSAAPADYGRAHVRMVTYQWRGGRGHRTERELFPGTSTIALAATGMIPPLSGAAIATIVAGSLTFDWSLGLKGLTYDDIYKRSSVFRGMRVPARFSVIVGAALALLAGYGARRILRLARAPAARALLCSALGLLVLFDLRVDPRLEPYRATIPSIYSRVTPDMVLAELPVEHQVDYMYFSTRHWARLLGGYSGYPGYSDTLMDGWKAFPSPASIDHFRRLGATHLTYNCALEERQNRCGPTFEELDGNPALELIASERWERADVRLYRIK
jgi:hypothetical protein